MESDDDSSLPEATLPAPEVPTPPPPQLDDSRNTPPQPATVSRPQRERREPVRLKDYVRY